MQTEVSMCHNQTLREQTDGYAAAEAGSVCRLSPPDFAELLGIADEDLPAECLDEIERFGFEYRTLNGLERDEVLLKVFRQVDSGTLTVAGKQGKGRWERGWSENLDAFVNSNGDVASLVPKYIRPAQPVRLLQNYVLPLRSEFELRWYHVFRTWLFRQYLTGFDVIYEFGCGSGHNLAALAQMFPQTRLVGLDWAAASRDIVNAMADRHGWKVEGRIFDFFSPDADLEILPNSAVLTIGALEQTGGDYEAFLQYLLRSNAALCVFIEPICEWYDENNLVDYAAIRFHRARKYWTGFPTRLETLQKAGRAVIVKKKRSFFGSLFLEGYSQLIWRPTSLQG